MNGSLPTELQVKAIEELNEVPDRIKDDIKKIRECTLILLPKPDPKTGARILMWVMKNSNPDTMPYSNLAIASLMVMDILMKEDNNSIVCGIKVWIDLTDCSPKYITQFTPVLLKKHIDCAEKGYPLRIKGMYVTNCPPFLEYTYHLVKSFSKSKIAKRLFLYKNIEDLYDEVPQFVMPREFGGESVSLDALKMAWKKKVESYREWFLEDLKSKSDESLRLGESKTISNVFGVEGSFRKMSFD
ncbi:hypothetical protein FQA39_LY15925 [Lamprigera yunnana]|nr:hypothetical protein FQA39_LY15925 [Lamprigera yunnana]